MIVGHRIRAHRLARAQVVVVAPAFREQTLIQRHRLVHTALADELAGSLRPVPTWLRPSARACLTPRRASCRPIHALVIVAKTPEQWSASSDVPKAPKCAGGDGRGMLK